MKLQIPVIITFLLMMSTAYSQNKTTVVSPVNGTELEIMVTPADLLIPVFYFEENSSSYKHKDSVKYFVDRLLENEIKSLQLYASANTLELMENNKVSEERGNTIAQLMQECGYRLENIQIADIKDQNPISHIENDPKNRRVEIAIMKN